MWNIGFKKTALIHTKARCTSYHHTIYPRQAIAGCKSSHDWRISLVIELAALCEFMSSTTEKSHMSNISYKATYMGKTICRTRTMSTTCMCICTGVSIYIRTQDIPQYMCTKNLVSYGQVGVKQIFQYNFEDNRKLRIMLE